MVGITRSARGGVVHFATGMTADIAKGLELAGPGQVVTRARDFSGAGAVVGEHFCPIFLGFIGNMTLVHGVEKKWIKSLEVAHLLGN